MPLVGRSVLRRPSRALQTLTPAPHLLSTPRQLVSAAPHYPAFTYIQIHTSALHCIWFLSSAACHIPHQCITSNTRTKHVPTSRIQSFWRFAAVLGHLLLVIFEHNIKQHSHFQPTTLFLNHLLLKPQRVCVCVCMYVSAYVLAGSYLPLCLPPQPSEKCGVLNVTKITENGKKVR